MFASRQPKRLAVYPVVLQAVTLAVLLGGCGGTMRYGELRVEGRRAMLARMHGPARYLFEECNRIKPRQVENLHDMGTCSLMMARDRFERENRAAAVRETDAAIAYFSEALDVHPGHQPSIEGKNIALELKGEFDEALEHAEWAAEFVGPHARQYIFLAREHEERGDVDGALLAYRQAAAMEPKNADAHVALAKFL
ncbi:MAG: hypothetical protein IID33_09690, partial [Planctomycetes bacterium]|nr:hypothetical protein [Planctomycetota bacterium]